jgi:hypothetical protein
VVLQSKIVYFQKDLALKMGMTGLLRTQAGLYNAIGFGIKMA